MTDVPDFYADCHCFPKCEHARAEIFYWKTRAADLAASLAHEIEKKAEAL